MKTATKKNYSAPAPEVNDYSRMTVQELRSALEYTQGLLKNAVHPRMIPIYTNRIDEIQAWINKHPRQ